MERKYIPEALQPDLKIRYEKGEEPVDVLAACAGLSRGVFTLRARELGWVPQNVDREGRRMRPRRPPAADTPKPPLDREVSAAFEAVPESGAPPDDETLARRIRRQVERELAAIEILRATIDPTDHAKFVLVARMLSGLVGTLQTSLRAEVLQRQQAAPPKVKQDDDFPRDFAELRRALAARLDAIVAEEED